MARTIRLYSDVPGIESFGRTGWPVFDADHNSIGPLPRFCGHNHKQKTIGLNAEGGFNISPTAAYPDGMCEWIAKLIFDNWMKSPFKPQRVGTTSRQDGNRRTTGDSQRWEPWMTEPGGAAFLAWIEQDHSGGRG